MEEDIQNCLPSVMFRGTPCSSLEGLCQQMEEDVPLNMKVVFDLS